MAQFSDFAGHVMTLMDSLGMNDVMVGERPGVVEFQSSNNHFLWAHIRSGPHGEAEVHFCAPLPASTTPPAQGTEYSEIFATESVREVWDRIRRHFVPNAT